jgi:hypothetical protein
MIRLKGRSRSCVRPIPISLQTAIAAVRENAKVPIEMRRSFGAWAEDTEKSQYHPPTG